VVCHTVWRQGLAQERSLYERNSIFFGLLIMLFMIMRWMRKAKPQILGGQSQRMCPNCGLITSRLQGKLLGVWQALHGGRVLDFKEMTAPFVHVLPERIKR
jgi:hypothetical protein